MDEINQTAQPSPVTNMPQPAPIQNAPQPVQKSGKTHIFMFTVGLVILIIAGVMGYFWYIMPHPSAQQLAKPVSPGKAQSQPSETKTITHSSMFAEYKEVPSTVKPAIPASPITVSELTNLNNVYTAVKIQPDAAKTTALEQQGFFTQPTKADPSDPEKQLLLIAGNRSDDMIDLYSEIGGNLPAVKRKPENAVFITSDFLLHIYHVLIDRTFQKIEEVKFQPAIKDLSKQLFADTIKAYNQENDPGVKESLKRLAVFYLVPLAILDSATPKANQYFNSPEDEEKALAGDKTADSDENIAKNLAAYQSTTPSDIYALARQELALVLKAQGFAASPLYAKVKPDALEDYSQYKPRSHYTKNAILRTYFRTMMWYGRHGFDVKSTELTRDAAIMTYQLSSSLVNSKPALQVWEFIYQPTVFFVGQSDDLSYYDYSTLLKNVYGDNISLSNFRDAKKLDQFQQQAKKLQGPKILSEIKLINPANPPTKDELLQSTKGFRFMGQRFIPDSYIFSSLTQGDEPADPETGQSLPSTPTALMVMSILGSNTADSLLTEWIKTEAPDSDKVIAKYKNILKAEFQKFDQKTWTQNIYWAWLYNLLPLFNPAGDGYPMFMRSAAWAKKSLQAALGSWTELRHDTLLYAKQSYAEMGGGPPEGDVPPVPKGYVEPNLSFITRLIALNTMTVNGLDSRQLLVPGQKEKFESYGKALEFFKTIAEKELANEQISDDDFETLRTKVRSDFPRIVWALEGDVMTEKDARMGIIADVHTDAVKGQVLYEAIGTPSIIYVAVKDKNGARLTRGAVYSYYEFNEAAQSRLSDEDWQARIYEGKDQQKIPQPPVWTKELVKP